MCASTCSSSDDVGSEFHSSGTGAGTLRNGEAFDTTFSPFRDPKISCVRVSVSELSSFELHPQEAAALGEAVSPKRRRDFMLGRFAARRSMQHLGCVEDSPVLRGEHREPVWPDGVVGSISHSGGFGVAAVGWQKDFSAIGIDIQQIEDRYSDDLIARFADPDEFDWVRSDPSIRTERAVKLFSAKESVFKALYPVSRVWFAFDAAKLTPRDGEFGFSAAVRLPAFSTGLIHLEVDVALVDGFVITGCWMQEGLSAQGVAVI
jgi:4'-phosphopantetheinyl transferase EntD